MGCFRNIWIVTIFLAALSKGEDSECKSLADRIKKLEKTHNEEIDNLRKDYIDEISTIRQALSAQTEKTNALAATVGRREDLIKDLLRTSKADATEERRTNVTIPTKPHGKRLVLSGETVAFTAYVDHNVEHMRLEQIIPYNQVITNIGDGFNNNTHTFTCPMSGLYLFTFVVSEIGDRELVAKLVIDGKNVIDAIANPIRGDHDQQGGNTAIIQVNQGQAVWVVNYFQQDVFLRTDENYRFASFSGVLLQPL